MKGAERRSERDLELATFTAWRIAQLTTYGGKTLPRLGDLLKEHGRKAAVPRRQSHKDMIAAMRAIAGRRSRLKGE